MSCLATLNEEQEVAQVRVLGWLKVRPLVDPILQEAGLMGSHECLRFETTAFGYVSKPTGKRARGYEHEEQASPKKPEMIPKLVHCLAHSMYTIFFHVAFDDQTVGRCFGTLAMVRLLGSRLVGRRLSTTPFVPSYRLLASRMSRACREDWRMLHQLA